MESLLYRRGCPSGVLPVSSPPSSPPHSRPLLKPRQPVSMQRDWAVNTDGSFQPPQDCPPQDGVVFGTEVSPLDAERPHFLEGSLRGLRHGLPFSGQCSLHLPLPPATWPEGRWSGPRERRRPPSHAAGMALAPGAPSLVRSSCQISLCFLLATARSPENVCWADNVTYKTRASSWPLWPGQAGWTLVRSARCRGAEGLRVLVGEAGWLLF